MTFTEYESPRDRRLTVDGRQVYAAFEAHPFIKVDAVGAQPAERYRVVYSVPGIWLDPATNTVNRSDQHLIEIFLPAEYPREKPYCTSPNPIFHPNFGNYVCIADFWSPSQALVDVIVQIGDMLQYKTFNTASPLNALAARWAELNIDRLPVGNKNLWPQEPEISLGPESFNTTGAF